MNLDIANSHRKVKSSITLCYTVVALACDKIYCWAMFCYISCQKQYFSSHLKILYVWVLCVLRWITASKIPYQCIFILFNRLLFWVLFQLPFFLGILWASLSEVKVLMVMTTTTTTKMMMMMIAEWTSDHFIQLFSKTFPPVNYTQLQRYWNGYEMCIW